MLPISKDYFWILLWPLSVVWACLHFLRRKFYPQAWKWRAPRPVLCVGNLAMGGSGKTPLVLYLAQRMSHFSPVVVSRGYRGRMEKQVACVDLEDPQGVVTYGDEPWMLAEQLKLPVYVGANRKKVLSHAMEQEPQVGCFLLDDGFQHLAVHKDLSLVVLSTEILPSQALAFPLGGYRESLSALEHADAVLLTPKGQTPFLTPWKKYLHQYFNSLPVFEVGYSDFKCLHPPSGEEAQGKGRWGVVSALSNNLDFQRQVRALGMVAVLEKGYPDHFRYDERTIEGLIEQSSRLGINRWVTTRKDYAKLEPYFTPLQSPKLFVLDYQVSLPQSFWIWIKAHWEDKFDFAH